MLWAREEFSRQNTLKKHSLANHCGEEAAGWLHRTAGSPGRRGTPSRPEGSTVTSRWVSEAVLSSLSATRKPQPGLGGQGSWARSQAFLFHFPDIIGGHEVLHKESESPHNDSFLRYNTLKCRRLGSFGTDRGRKKGRKDKFVSSTCCCWWRLCY